MTSLNFKGSILKGAWIALVLSVGGGVAVKANAVECINEHGVVVPSVTECDPSPQPHGGGGDMPIPFGLNGKVELADGESYLLIGKIMISPKARGRAPRVFFEVDFNQHPWLANSKRINNPLYPVEGSVSVWQAYDGQTIKFACRAHGRVQSRDKGAPEYVIWLEGLQSP